MFPLKTILYLILLTVCVIFSSFYHPFLGLISYLVTYLINPVDQWWGEPIASMGIRVNFIVAAVTIASAILLRSKLKFKRFFESQDILLIFFIFIIYLSVIVGMGFNDKDNNSFKMLKACIILITASHIITEYKIYEKYIWLLIITGGFLGYETFTAPASMFQGGRLGGGVGAADFNETNFLAAHLAAMLPFIGAMFLKGHWKQKVICLFCGGLILNGVVLCRSRGSFLALASGLLCGIIFSNRNFRKKIIFGLLSALIGAILITDTNFWLRMKQIDTNEDSMDASSEGRIIAWKAALEMIKDRPLGMGEGNFKKFVGSYNPLIPGKDTHNTFFRCLAELGLQGAVVFVFLVINAFKMLFNIGRQIEGLPQKESFLWHIWALKTSLVIYLTAGMFITQTYVEDLYWFLMMPLFLKRAVQNERIEMAAV